MQQPPSINTAYPSCSTDSTHTCCGWTVFTVRSETNILSWVQKTAEHHVHTALSLCVAVSRCDSGVGHFNKTVLLFKVYCPCLSSLFSSKIAHWFLLLVVTLVPCGRLREHCKKGNPEIPLRVLNQALHFNSDNWAPMSRQCINWTQILKYNIVLVALNTRCDDSQSYFEEMLFEIYSPVNHCLFS